MSENEEKPKKKPSFQNWGSEEVKKAASQGIVKFSKGKKEK